MSKSKATSVAKYVRSIQRTLANEHGLKLPYAALRASVLQAQGLNPHALNKRPSSKDAGHAVQTEAQWSHAVATWMGDNDVVLKKTAYDQLLKLPFKKNDKPYSAQPAEQHDADYVERRIYWNAKDIDDLLSKPSLSQPTSVFSSLTFDASLLKGLALRVTEVKWIFTNYPSVSARRRCMTALEFQAENLGFDLSKAQVRIEEEPRMKFSGGWRVPPEAWLCFDVQLPKDVWNKILIDAFDKNEYQYEALREWLGQHYGRIFEACSPEDKLEWMDRYVDSLEN